MQLYTNSIQFTPAQGYTRRNVNVYTTSMADEPLNQFVEDVERDLLAHIYNHLKENQMTAESAQKLAQQFLSLLPFKDKKDLLDKLNELGKEYPEARETYAKYIGSYEEQERQRKLDLMRQHIKQGNLEEAIAVAKGNEGNNQESQVKGGQYGSTDSTSGSQSN